MDARDYERDQYGLPIGPPFRSGSMWMLNGLKPAFDYYTIEVPIPAQATPSGNYSFNNVVTGFLLNAFIWSIEVYSAATMSKSPTGVALLPQAAVNVGYLQMQDNKGFVFWNNKPFRDCQTINDTASKAGKSYPDSLQGRVINWQNCSVVFSDPTQITANTAFSLLLGVSFTLNNNWQIDGVGAPYLKQQSQ